MVLAMSPLCDRLRGMRKAKLQWKRIFVTAAVACLAAAAAFAIRAQSSTSHFAGPDGKHAQVRVAFDQKLPAMNGADLEAHGVEVSYGPGGSSEPHSHPCPVIGYVLEGTLRTQVKGSPEAIYKAGESFYEPPNGVHQVSANASQTEPLRLLAIFVCDHPTPLSVPPPQDRKTGGK